MIVQRVVCVHSGGGHIYVSLKEKTVNHLVYRVRLLKITSASNYFIHGLPRPK